MVIRKRTLVPSVTIQGPTGPIDFVFITMEELGFARCAPAHLHIYRNFCKEWSEVQLTGQAIEFCTWEEARTVRAHLEQTGKLKETHVTVFAQTDDGFNQLWISPRNEFHHWVHDGCRFNGTLFGNVTAMYRLVTG